MKAEFIEEMKCAVCGGVIQVWAFEVMGRPRVTYTHNGWTYTDRNRLVRECTALKKARELK